MGLLRIITAIAVIVIATLMMPLSLLWGDNPPPELKPLYDLPYFNWQMGVIIVSMLGCTIIVGVIFFIGWQRAHPLIVKRIDLKDIITTKHASTIAKIGNGINGNNGQNHNSNNDSDQNSNHNTNITQN